VPTDLKSTINLPKTGFPMKAGLPQNEPKILARWEERRIYDRIREVRKGAPTYVLHDGPPYANGPIHLGTAMNKCLKDFIVKSKNMAGFDSPYVPGWDCHGLPIEIKVDQMLGGKKLQMKAVDVRAECRKYAEKFLELQRSQFKRIGVFGRWDQPYSTMTPQYEAAVLDILYRFLENDFVYKGLRSVYWCVFDETALAEAEVEYENHTSPTVWVKYPFAGDPVSIDAALRGKKLSTIIWTTTPWTLPASMAVAFHPDEEYVALESGDDVFIVGARLAEDVKAKTGLQSAREIARFHGRKMEYADFRHPFLDRKVLGVLADYVTMDQGTGVVHTAPAHGAEDFITGQKYQIDPTCNVDKAGILRNGLPEYEGKRIFDANAPIIELLKARGVLMHSEKMEHSYPHCWRCHNPVIFRATEQWFIGMDTPMKPAAATPAAGAVPVGGTAPAAGAIPAAAVTPAASGSVSGYRFSDTERAAKANAPSGADTMRSRTLAEIAKVKWDPAWGEERISNMIATRPDWCISRQRIWGVPIAVFLCDNCGKPVNDPHVNRRVVQFVSQHGADAWYTPEADAILADGHKCVHCGSTKFKKETDILDVWFESGSSHAAVLGHEPNLPWPADLYLEGGDQHRGWFHSSLLCAIGYEGSAPYRMVATSGWTLDEQGRAMSKSLGNTVDPVEIADTLGGEIVRMWVASVDFREDVACSPQIMQRVAGIYRDIRNTFRFILGNLDGFDPVKDAVAFDEMQPIDQYMLQQTVEVSADVQRSYEEFAFHKIYHRINNFCGVELSAFYFDVLKDRLYTSAPKSVKRRAAQTAIWRMGEALVRLLAPIMSFTCEEVWQYLPAVAGRLESVHLTTFPEAGDLLGPDDAANVADTRQADDWKIIRAVRETVLKALEEARSQKLIGGNLQAQVTLTAGDPVYSALQRFKNDLRYFFIVSAVELKKGTGNGDSPVSVQVSKAAGEKCERCWNFSTHVGEDKSYPTVCERCSAVLKEIGES
jgi:isoleucyl-tRNA synthetase